MMSTVAQRIASASTSIEINQRANEFLAIGRALVATRDPAAAERFLRRAPVADRVIETFHQRAAVLPATTTDSTWAAPLSQLTLSSDAFGEFLRSAGAFDRCLGDGAFLRLPPMQKIAILTAAATATTVLETNVKPATVMAATTVDLTMSKVAAYCVITEELMRSAGPGAINLLRRELSG